MKGRWILGVLLCVFVSGTLLAENRFFVDETPLISGASDQVIPLLFDNDQEVFGYSFALRVDPAKLAIQDVTFAGTVAETADFLDGAQDAAEGIAAYGIVFETDKAIAEQQLPAGTDRVIGLLTVDVLATDDTTADVTFESVLLPSVSPQPVTNIMTVVEKNQALSVLPNLVNGTVPIEKRSPPRITDFENARGEAGTVFTIIGENFEGDLTVRVCDVAASAEPPTDGGTRVLVTAPVCTSTGPVAVEVCNDFGCDADPAGFTYPGGEPSFVRGDGNSDNAINITDGISLLGHLFVGDDPPKCLDAADADDSGTLNVTDAIVVLQFLFLGEAPPRAPSPPEGRPYETQDCGPDPTSDELSCEESSMICSTP